MKPLEFKTKMRDASGQWFRRLEAGEKLKKGDQCKATVLRWSEWRDSLNWQTDYGQSECHVYRRPIPAPSVEELVEECRIGLHFHMPNGVTCIGKENAMLYLTRILDGAANCQGLLDGSERPQSPDHNCIASPPELIRAGQELTARLIHKAHSKSEQKRYEACGVEHVPFDTDRTKRQLAEHCEREGIDLGAMKQAAGENCQRVPGPRRVVFEETDHREGSASDLVRDPESGLFDSLGEPFSLVDSNHVIYRRVPESELESERTQNQRMTHAICRLAELVDLERINVAHMKELDECAQVAGKAMGYPWFKDDQKNFPGATEEDGVCIGAHVPVTIVRELASQLAAAKSLLAEHVGWHETDAEHDHAEYAGLIERSKACLGGHVVDDTASLRSQLAAANERVSRAEKLLRQNVVGFRDSWLDALPPAPQDAGGGT